MKIKLIALITAISMMFVFCACSQSDTLSNEEAAALISDIPTTKYFTDEPVSEGDMETILMAGINTPSSMNLQPWHFSAVTDKAVLQKIADDMSSAMKFAGPPPALDNAPEIKFDVFEQGINAAPLAIIISCKAGCELDAGLACRSMSASAHLLGYATKIISSPTIALNGENKAYYYEIFGVPEDQTIVTVLLVGKADTSKNEGTDGNSSASPRNPFDEVVTFVNGDK